MRARRCPGDCNATRRGEVRPLADYPAAHDPMRCLLFWCRGCRRYQPWCRGAADAHFKLCDPCANAAAKPKAAA